MQCSLVTPGENILTVKPCGDGHLAIYVWLFFFLFYFPITESTGN